MAHQLYVPIQIIFSNLEFIELVSKDDYDYLFNEIYKVLKITIKQFKITKDQELVYVSSYILYNFNSILI